MNRQGHEQFNLIGFVNPYAVIPAFVYPIFSRDNQYYYEDGAGYRIKEFIKTNADFSQNVFSPIKDTNGYFVGAETIYAFQVQQDNIIYGDSRKMLQYLEKVRNHCSNNLLIDEIDAVLAQIIIAMLHENTTVQINNSTPKATKIVLKRYDNVLRISKAGEKMAPPSQFERLYQKYVHQFHHYNMLLKDFIILFNALLEHFDYDLDHCNTIFQLILFETRGNALENDALTIRKQIRAKRRKRPIPAEAFRDEKMIMNVMQILNRETAKQEEINTLLCKYANPPLSEISERVKLYSKLKKYSNKIG